MKSGEYSFEKKIKLREETNSQIFFSKEGFCFQGFEENNPQEFFLYEKVEDLDFLYKKTNVFVSAISIIIDFLLGTAVGGIFKSKDLIIQFIYHSSERKFWFKHVQEDEFEDIKSSFYDFLNL